MTFRAFIAVDVGPLPGLIELGDRLRHSGADLKLVEPENIHVTLKFLGDTDEALVDQIAEHISESAAGITPFELSLKNIGAFPNMNYMKVIWVGIEGAESLVKMAKELNTSLRSLGFKSEKKGFKPHLTIARVRSPKRKAELQKTLTAQQDAEFGAVLVDKIVLKKSVLSSSGPTYTDIKEIKLEPSENQPE